MQSKEDALRMSVKRSYMVVKGNEIIQKAKFDLGIKEQKIFCYVVSKIKPTDTADMTYTFTINDYCEICGISKRSGKNIEDIKETLKHLRDKSFYLLSENGSWVLIGWLSKVKIQPKSGKIIIKFDEDMQKYLIGLSKEFTQYNLLYILPMRSTYSIRIYELLKSYASQMKECVEIDIDELKSRLAAPYVNFKDFRRKVLEPAMKEINAYTDIEFSWQGIKEGRRVAQIRFLITNRSAWDRFKNASAAEAALEK